MDCLDASRVEARDIQPHLKPASSLETMAFSNIVVLREDEEGIWSWFEEIRILTGMWRGYQNKPDAEVPLTTLG